jgi:hypothetical protein
VTRLCGVSPSRLRAERQLPTRPNVQGQPKVKQ